MCCTSSSHHGFHGGRHYHACFCGCDRPGSYVPRFMTEKQKIDNLEKHLEILQEETKAVKEHLEQIKKEK